LITNCQHCGNQFERHGVKRPRKYCSTRCYGLATAAANRVGLPSDSKRCPKCSEVKQLSSFHGVGRNRFGWCKSCHSANERARRLMPRNVDKRRNLYETDMTFRARQLVRAIEKRCRRNGIPFELDPEWLASRLSAGRCELSGIKFELKIHRSDRAHPFSPSVDRIAPSLGYTKSNCRVVLFALNMAMSDFGIDILLQMTDAVRRRMLGVVA
jgi:hypothetical protein